MKKVLSAERWVLSAGCFVLMCVVLASVVAGQAPSRPQPYKVVFDLTSDDPLDQAAVLRWFDGVRRVFTPALIRERRNFGDPSSVPVFYRRHDPFGQHARRADSGEPSKGRCG